MMAVTAMMVTGTASGQEKPAVYCPAGFVSVLAFGANILGIKPSLAIIDGELKVVKKYRGSLPICVGKYITDLLDGRDDIDNSMVFISSCQPKPGCMEAIKAGLRKYGKFENIIETDIGTTIGGYSGPGTIGIVFAKKV